jgi:membrane protein
VSGRGITSTRSTAPLVDRRGPSGKPSDVAEEKKPGTVARLKSRYEGYRDAHPWLRHSVEAWGLLQRNNGNQYAAAITYFSFLAIFPLLLLAAGVAGYVLAKDPSLERSLFRHIAEQIPGQFGQKLSESLQKAIDNRTGVGLIGLFGVLLTGLGWIGNLRQAIDGVWGRTPPKRNFLMARVSNLVVLGGLGLGLLVSLGLTAVGTSLTDQVLSAVGLDSLPGATVVLKILGIAIAALGDTVIFWWLLVKLPQVDVLPRVAFKGALMASVGLEALKILGTYTIAHASHSPTAGPFASIIAVLVWIQLVARLLLFTCAWMATVTAEYRGAAAANTIPVFEPEVMAEDESGEASSPSPAAVGATLVGAGAVAGAMAHWAVTRPHALVRRTRPRPPRRSRQPW